jgi:regulator of sigma E protease
MDEAKSSSNHDTPVDNKPGWTGNDYFRIVFFVAVLLAVIYLVGRNLGVFGNILVVVVGFGGVVIVHEFGHFIVAKLSGIKVEAFSIFMPPTVLGILKTKDGFRLRILPQFFPSRKRKGEGEQQGKSEDEGLLGFTVGRGGKAGETEYRIGLIPLGGFVKMLGQDDTKGTEVCDDPRSYANKPIPTRMAVIAAGVIFNILSAAIAFMVVFMVGINLPPPVVGGVTPDTPAAQAGLKAGDEIVEINGKSKTLDFSNIVIAAALSSRGEKVLFKVRRGDRIIDVAMVAEELSEGDDMRRFGIVPPQTLTVANVSDPNMLEKQVNLRPGDVVTAVNGREVRHYWELADIVLNSVGPTVTITARGTRGADKDKVISTEIGLGWGCASGYQGDSESKLCHVGSMVPRLRIVGDLRKPVSFKESLLRKLGISKPTGVEKPILKHGDIILAAGNVEYPTYKEFRDVVKGHDGEPLSLKILRADTNGVERPVEVTVEPKHEAGTDRVVIGIPVTLDVRHAVVAKTINSKNGPPGLAIPRGAVITTVGGAEISSFYDVAGEIRENAGQPVTIGYRSSDGKTGEVVLDAKNTDNLITVWSMPAEVVPFEPMKRLYKASGPVDAIVTGYQKTVMFIAQTYVTLRRLVGGLVSPKSLLGPVGILTVSYTVVSDQPLVNYIYLLALIGACVAVVNFMPLPPFDGGHIVLLLIEKIRGSALSERTQGVIAYAGVVFVIALFLYLTFNDVVNLFVR